MSAKSRYMNSKYLQGTIKLRSLQSEEPVIESIQILGGYLTIQEDQRELALLNLGREVDYVYDMRLEKAVIKSIY